MILKKWSDLIIENVDDLAKIMTIEQGKPLAEPKGEILMGASYIEFYAEEAKRVYGDIVPDPRPGKRILVIDVSSKNEKKKPMIFINPVIKNVSKETSVYEEGCLSLPDTFIEIERPKFVVIQFIDQNGLKKDIL